MKSDLRVLGEPFVDGVAFVSGEVIEDNVEFSILVRGNDLIHKLDEFIGAAGEDNNLR